jgi:hypothetical protein
MLGGAINGRRLYVILSRGGDPVSSQIKGMTYGFLAGAIFYGLPMWAMYAFVNHLIH